MCGHRRCSGFSFLTRHFSVTDSGTTKDSATQQCRQPDSEPKAQGRASQPDTAALPAWPVCVSACDRHQVSDFSAAGFSAFERVYTHVWIWQSSALANVEFGHNTQSPCRQGRPPCKHHTPSLYSQSMLLGSWYHTDFTAESYQV